MRYDGSAAVAFFINSFIILRSFCLPFIKLFVMINFLLLVFLVVVLLIFCFLGFQKKEKGTFVFCSFGYFIELSSNLS